MSTRYYFDENGVRRIVDTVRRVEATPVNQIPQPQSPVGSGMRENWIPCINDSGESIPPYSICRLGTGAQYSGYLRPKLSKPSTTFGSLYGPTGNWTTPSGKPTAVVGPNEVCIVAYDTGTPAFRETWGPKPGQWTVSKGFPGVSVIGIWNAEKKLLLGTVGEIRTLLCKATADLSTGAVSSDYVIWRGTIASGADSGFTTLPSIEIEQDIANNAFFVAHFVNGGWVSLSNAISLTEITVVTAYRVDAATLKLQYKTRTAEVVNPGTESGWTDAHTGVECTE